MRCLDKLKSTKGESISETLVATLIAALAMVMFASMVIASKNIIKDSNSAMEKYYDLNSRMMESRNSDSPGVLVKDAEVSFTKAPVCKDSLDVKLYYNQSADDSEKNEIQLKCYG